MHQCSRFKPFRRRNRRACRSGASLRPRGGAKDAQHWGESPCSCRPPLYACAQKPPAFPRHFEPFVFDKNHPSHFAALPFSDPWAKKVHPCTKRQTGISTVDPALPRPLPRALSPSMSSPANMKGKGTGRHGRAGTKRVVIFQVN